MNDDLDLRGIEYSYEFCPPPALGEAERVGRELGSVEPTIADTSVGTARGTARCASTVLVAAMAATCALVFGCATAYGAGDPATTTPAAATTPTPPDEESSAPIAAVDGAVQPESLAPAGSDSPTPVADASVDVGQAAAAAATATQDKPSNEHVSVQAGTPGATPAVSQQNTASANAEAGTVVELVPGPADATTDTEPGTAPAPISQQANAAASANQVSPINTNVEVRVGSPGDNGPVTQINAAAASSASGAESPAQQGNTPQADVGGNLGSQAHAQAVSQSSAHAGQDSPTNANVSVRVNSPGNDGPVVQANTAAATASASGIGAAQASSPNANASTSQTAATNTNVAVRVNSGGSTPAASQSSTTSTTQTSNGNADTTTAGDEATQTTTVHGDGNTDLVVSVDDAGLADPLAGNGSFAAWIWKWTWTSDDDLASKLAAGQPIDTPGSWQWDVVTGDAASAAGGTSLKPGDWIWNWTWNRPGDFAWTWNWAPPTPLDCNCAWVWDWSWSWSVGTSSDQHAAAPGSGATPSSPQPAVVQRNDARAEAEASASATIGQSVVQNGSDADQFSGQIAEVVQATGAQADVIQSNATNSWWGSTPVAQQNEVDAAAVAGARTAISQSAAQSGDESATPVANGTTPARPAQWSGQQVQVAQLGSAWARGHQAGVTNTGATSNHLGVGAAAGTEAATRQDVSQAATGSGELTQWAGQLIQLGQAADAFADGVQLGLATDTFSRIATAVAGAGAEATVLQGSAQTALGGGDTSQHSAQLVTGLQSAAATAATMQHAAAAVGPDGFARSSSTAAAANGALVAEAATQFVVGPGIQEVTQNAFFEQSATASSTSLGGIGGTAIAWNCTTISQSSGQAFGSGLPGALLGDSSAYCTVPVAPVPAAAFASPASGLAADASAAVLTPPALATPSDHELFPHAARGPYGDAHPTSSADARRASSTLHIFGAPPDAAALAGAARIEGAIASSPSPAESITPALIPGRRGDDKAGVEPPFPPVSGTPAGPGSLIPGLGGGGGAAAMMAVLVLTLLGAWRTYSESDVRRPTFFREALASPG